MIDNMKKFIYAGICIFAILLASYFLVFYLNKAQIAKETKMMEKEFSSIFEENKTSKDIYLNIDALLQKYPKADVKLRDVAKECHDFFEEAYDFQQKYEVSLNNVVGMTISSFTTFLKGETSPFSKMHSELKVLEKKRDELNFHLKEVGVYLCDKYGIDCKKEEGEEGKEESNEQADSP